MRRSKGFSRLLRVTTLVIAGVAIRQELRKDASDREWHGAVGFVPYDFRFPTPARIKDKVWNPDDERIFMPQVFGVGWSLNLGRLVHVLRSS